MSNSYSYNFKNENMMRVGLKTNNDYLTYDLSQPYGGLLQSVIINQTFMGIRPALMATEYTAISITVNLSSKTSELRGLWGLELVLIQGQNNIVNLSCASNIDNDNKLYLRPVSNTKINVLNPSAVTPQNTCNISFTNKFFETQLDLTKSFNILLLGIVDDYDTIQNDEIFNIDIKIEGA